MTYDWTTELPGVVSVHADECPVRDGQECACGPIGFRASIRDPSTHVRNVSPSFRSIPEAQSWKREQVKDQADPGSHPGHADRTHLGPLIDDFLQAAEDGLARDSAGSPYSLERQRTLRGGLSYTDSELGRMAVGDVRRRDILGLVAQLRAAGVDGTRIVAVVEGLNELYSYAIRNDLVGFSPVVELSASESEMAVPNVDALQPSFPPAPHPGGPETSSHWSQVPPLSPRHALPPEAPAASQKWQGSPEWQAGSREWPAAAQEHQAASPFGSTGFAAAGVTAPPAAPQGGVGPYASGSRSAMFAAPGPMRDANYDANMQEQWLWWTVRIIVIVFVLIALVLAAVSV